MSDNLTGIDPAVAVGAIESNLHACLALFARLPGSELREAPELVRFTTGLPFPLANGICRARLRPECVDDDIDAAMEPFHSRALPMLWWVTPSDTPVDLGDRLTAHGLIPRGASRGMAVDLLELPELNLPQGVRIERVCDATTMSDYATPLREGFGLSKVGVRFFADLFTVLGFGDNSRAEAYLAYLDGRPVASSALVTGAGTAGIYNVATRPEARNRGIGTAMTLAAMYAARERGYRIATMEASEMGYPVYVRLGFREFCKISNWAWIPEQASAAD